MFFFLFNYSSNPVFYFLFLSPLLNFYPIFTPFLTLSSIFLMPSFHSFLMLSSVFFSYPTVTLLTFIPSSSPFFHLWSFFIFLICILFLFLCLLFLFSWCLFYVSPICIILYSLFLLFISCIWFSFLILPPLSFSYLVLSFFFLSCPLSPCLFIFLPSSSFSFSTLPSVSLLYKSCLFFFIFLWVFKSFDHIFSLFPFSFILFLDFYFPHHSLCVFIFLSFPLGASAPVTQGVSHPMCASLPISRAALEILEVQSLEQAEITHIKQDEEDLLTIASLEEEFKQMSAEPNLFVTDGHEDNRKWIKKWLIFLKYITFL